MSAELSLAVAGWVEIHVYVGYSYKQWDRLKKFYGNSLVVSVLD